jgi:malate synthase
MEEILYELRDHSAGLNCGRWDYIFSFIKKFRAHPSCVLPDRAELTMSQHFLRSYSLHLIQACHKRGAHALGGMAAQIPLKDDEQGNEVALEKVRIGKTREAQSGHDGSWVAHPALVPVVREVFDRFMPGVHQICTPRDEVNVTAADLLAVPKGEITLDGIRTNMDVSIRYMESWLRGIGCVPLNNLMEDAATAEIARAQLWQWLHHGTAVAQVPRLSAEFYEDLASEELTAIRSEVGDDVFRGRRFGLAASLVLNAVLNDSFVEFLTLPAYDHID